MGIGLKSPADKKGWIGCDLRYLGPDSKNGREYVCTCDGDMFPDFLQYCHAVCMTAREAGVGGLG